VLAGARLGYGACTATKDAASTTAAGGQEGMTTENSRVISTALRFSFSFSFCGCCCCVALWRSSRTDPLLDGADVLTTEDRRSSMAGRMCTFVDGPSYDRGATPNMQSVTTRSSSSGPPGTQPAPPRTEACCAPAGC
jgi:hypothetical protein